MVKHGRRVCARACLNACLRGCMGMHVGLYCRALCCRYPSLSWNSFLPGNYQKHSERKSGRGRSGLEGGAHCESCERNPGEVCPEHKEVSLLREPLHLPSLPRCFSLSCQRSLVNVTLSLPIGLPGSNPWLYFHPISLFQPLLQTMLQSHRSHSWCRHTLASRPLQLPFPC